MGVKEENAEGQSWKEDRSHTSGGSSSQPSRSNSGKYRKRAWKPSQVCHLEAAAVARERVGGEEAGVVFSESKRKGCFLLGLLFRLAALIPLLTFQLMCMFSFYRCHIVIHMKYILFLCFRGLNPGP